jgi:hypothetical protein
VEPARFAPPPRRIIALTCDWPATQGRTLTCAKC